MATNEIRTVEEAIEDFNQRNGIVYELCAKLEDGEILYRATSSQSFNDVIGFSQLGDEHIEKLAIKEQETRADLEGERHA